MIREAIVLRDIFKRDILAGHCIFTVAHSDSKFRYTYMIKQDKHNHNRYLCYRLYGEDNAKDYKYLFLFYKDTWSAQITGVRDLPTNVLIAVLVAISSESEWPRKCLLYHSKHCCACGRLLTTPESIERGYGPNCYETLYGVRRE